MQIRVAQPEEFEAVRAFYWDLIDQMQGQSDTIGWKKGIYPSDEFIQQSLANGELFVMDDQPTVNAGAQAIYDLLKGTQKIIEEDADPEKRPVNMGVNPMAGQGFDASRVQAQSEQESVQAAPNGPAYKAAVIVNNSCNEGYEGLSWSINCDQDGVLIPHALAVRPDVQGQGLGQIVMMDIIEQARFFWVKTIRLDVLSGNAAAEKLYTKMGFKFVGAKDMFYEDTGLTEYKMFELVL